MTLVRDILLWFVVIVALLLGCVVVISGGLYAIFKRTAQLMSGGGEKPADR
jgi:hypothetical protein